MRQPDNARLKDPLVIVQALFYEPQSRDAVHIEWNDAIENDIMELKREVTDVFFKQGITKFILVAENVMNFHSGDKDYYAEWFEEVTDEDGWIVVLNMPEQTQYDFKRSCLHR